MTAKRSLIQLFRMATIVFIIAIGSPGCGNSTFLYQAAVTELGTSRPIENVVVRLEVAGMSALTGMSDSFGNVQILIPAEYINQQGRLVIDMPGYKYYTQNVTLLNDRLPADIPLTPSGNLDNQSSPDAPPTSTSIPPATATSTALPKPATPTASPESPKEEPVNPANEMIAPVEEPTVQPVTESPEPSPSSPEKPQEPSEIKPEEPVVPPLLSGKLAFPLKINDEYKVYVVQVNENPSGQLYASIGNARQPQLSPDGSQLLVDGTGTGDMGAILQMSSNGREARAVTCPAITVKSYFPTWSPDGTQLAFDGGEIHHDRRQIYLDDIGNSDCQIDDNYLVVQGGEAIENNGLYPLWASDNWLYFRSCATWNNNPGICGIWAVQMNGNGFDQITDNPNHIPTDANNRHVLFMFNDNGNWDVYTVNSHTGGTPRNLTQNESADIWGTLSPDGQTVAFISNRGGDWAIWMMNIDGSNPRPWLTIDTFNWGTVIPEEIFLQRMSWSN